MGKSLNVPQDRAGRIMVEADLRVPGHPEIFVIGDLAYVTSNDKPVPGVAAAAKQMGCIAARNILRQLEGQTSEIFRYKDPGSLATIGRRAAIVMLGKIKFSGFSAWLFWLFVHIYFLIGFRNRLMVMTDWAWAYLTFQRSARIVVGTDRRNDVTVIAKP